MSQKRKKKHQVTRWGTFLSLQILTSELTGCWFLILQNIFILQRVAESKQHTKASKQEHSEFSAQELLHSHLAPIPSQQLNTVYYGTVLLQKCILPGIFLMNGPRPHSRNTLRQYPPMVSYSTFRK